MRTTTALVAAAASVPSSSTRTNALCTTSEMNGRPPPPGHPLMPMPERFAFVRWKASGIPIDLRVSDRSKLDSNSNFGMVKETGLKLILLVAPLTTSAFSDSSKPLKLPLSGSRITMDSSWPS